MTANNNHILTYPFKDNALVVMLTLTPMFSLLYWAVGFNLGSMMFSIPAIVILLPLFVKYCFSVGHNSMHRDHKPPRMDFSGAGSFDGKSMMFIIVMVILFGFLVSLLGGLGGMAVTALLLPAIISAFVIEGSISSAINPLNWFSIIISLHVFYLVPGALLAMAIYSIMLIPEGWLAVFKVILTLYICIVLFRAIGLFLYRKREALGIEIVETREEMLERFEREEQLKAFSREAQLWHNMSNVKRYSDAIKDILEYIHCQDYQLQTYEDVMQELLGWRDIKMAARFLPVYVDKLISAQQSAKGFAAMLSVFDRNGSFELSSPQSLIRMAELARSMQRNELAIQLLEDLNRRFSGAEQQQMANNMLTELKTT